MPFTVHDLEGRPVRVATYRPELHENKIVCPDCGWPMQRRRAIPDKRVAHFAHRPPQRGERPRKCAWALMTPEHHNALRALQDTPPQVFEALAGAYGREEARLEDGSRRADVLFVGAEGRHPVAFEAQFSGIQFGANGTGRTIEERTRDYHANGVHVVWCFFEGRRGARELFDACRRAYGCAGWLAADGNAVAFEGVTALWLDRHPIDAMDDRTAWRRKQEAERLAELARQRREEAERLAEEDRLRAEQIARMEARLQAERADDARRRAAEWQASQARLREDAARRRAEYERRAEERRQAEIAALERARAEAAARVAEVNRRLGVDPARDAFTVEPVAVPASATLGTPRRTLYRVLFRGAPVGWLDEARVRDRLAQLNTAHAGRRKKGAA